MYRLHILASKFYPISVIEILAKHRIGAALSVNVWCACVCVHTFEHVCSVFIVFAENRTVFRQSEDS